MNTKLSDTSLFDASHLLLFLVSRWKPIVIISVIALIASIIFSSPFFIPPKYESTVILFPSTTSSISKALIATDNSQGKDWLQLGEEGAAEQLLQILYSDEIRDRIIAKYNLMQHYDINEKEEKYPYTQLHKKYSDNITYRRTEYMSVEINVLDTDRDTAAMIANDIADLLDTAKDRMQKEVALQAFAIVEREYNDLKEYVKQIEDSLKALGEFGVYDYQSQSEVLNTEYAKAIAKDNAKAIIALEKKLALLAKYGGKQMAMSLNMEYATSRLALLKIKYDEIKIDANQKLPHKFVVNKAYPAEKKSYPVRWLIVAITTFSAFLFVIFLIVLFEKIKWTRVN